MRVLITGANSFVGSNFKRYSKCRNVNEVSLLVNKPTDINFSKYEIVIHLAAIVHQNKKIPDSESKRINFDLAFDVAKKAKQQGVQQFIFMSTVKVYGESNNDEPWTEVTLCNPVDSYGKSKYEAEKRLLELQDDHFTVSIIRSPVVYGPGVKGNILSLIKLVDKVPLLPLGGIKNKRAMVFAGNLIELISRIIEMRSPGIFLAGDSEQISTTEFVQKISLYLDKKNLIINIPGLIKKLIKKTFPAYYNKLWGSLAINPGKTFDKLKFIPPYTIEEGIAETIDWYKRKFK